MFSNMYFYLMVVVLVFAIGDMIGHFTKGKLSGMMMVMLLFLIAFLAGILPGDIIDKAGLPSWPVPLPAWCCSIWAPPSTSSR